MVGLYPTIMKRKIFAILGALVGGGLGIAVLGTASTRGSAYCFVAELTKKHSFPNYFNMSF
jgi:hypothetical protein